MKPTNQMIENRLKHALEVSVPDVLPELLQRIKTKEEIKTMDNKQTHTTKLQVMNSGRRSRSTPRWQKAAGFIAACLIFVTGAYFGFVGYSTQSVIAFDVNPSIELSTNRADKVLKATANNEEARQVIADMDFKGMSFDDAVKALKGMDLDTAVNALIGSMVKNGYIDEIKNSILITVNSKNAEKGIQLQQHLSEEIEGFLNNYSVKGAILSQTAKADAQQRKLANQYRISTGKASLIDWLVKQDPTIQYADVADLSINDINLLIRARNTKMEGMDFRGEASTKGYIGEEKARQIAFEHAGVLKTEVQKLEVELDFEDGRMVYEVEFYHNDKEYDYEIDAKNGNILEFKVKNRHGPDGSTPTTTPGNQYIGAVEAKEIALRHAGYEVGLVNRLRTEFEDENGRMIYEVEFEHGNFKYEYEIDAVTGEILQSEVEKLEAGNNGEGNPETSADPEANYIGDGKAEEIALQHATLKRNSVRNLKVEREREQDRVIYEIQFEHGNYKYEYEIDALTGKIVQWEKEQN